METMFFHTIQGFQQWSCLSEFLSYVFDCDYPHGFLLYFLYFKAKISYNQQRFFLSCATHILWYHNRRV